ncbi:hypothetical protein [Tenuibacillus multivorans]|uniref:Uncharacterized protein n=1 Tax=Tenuibacillus multivorans TaxID=237069 RepID=A0A1H0AXR7_9BACI|nr:hypothetical protein [Tenuibacillus multivorans]GEL77622.1 hypothetical protein TMU01_18570 [Tenuibacillus multivorans]SDN38217.1 hypothetical protein SAMN05216498_2126 [Tenuibacillus multivorans]
MRLFSRLLIGIGVIALLIGIFQFLYTHPISEWEEWQEVLTYALFESSARIAGLFGVIFIVIGWLLHKKVKKKGRIFY